VTIAAQLEIRLGNRGNICKAPVSSRVVGKPVSAEAIEPCWESSAATKVPRPSPDFTDVAESCCVILKCVSRRSQCLSSLDTLLRSCQARVALTLRALESVP